MLPHVVFTLVGPPDLPHRRSVTRCITSCSERPGGPTPTSQSANSDGPVDEVYPIVYVEASTETRSPRFLHRTPTDGSSAANDADAAKSPKPGPGPTTSTLPRPDGRAPHLAHHPTTRSTKGWPKAPDPTITPVNRRG